MPNAGPPSSPDPDSGKLFSEVYGERGLASQDDDRFRSMIWAAFGNIFRREDHGNIARFVTLKSGMEIACTVGYNAYYHWEEFIKRVSINDLLDVITLILRWVESNPYQDKRGEDWILAVRSALANRQMAYEMNKQGAIRHRVDAVFQRGAELTLACLRGAALEGPRIDVDAAFDDLLKRPPDTKGAAMKIFSAAETVFKLVVQTGSALTNGNASASLMPIIQRLVENGDQAIKQAQPRLVSAFASWSDACQPYRHGQREEDIVAPPMDLAVALVSQGADHIRWMMSLRHS
jgi:hypothetical protein